MQVGARRAASSALTYSFTHAWRNVACVPAGCDSRVMLCGRVLALAILAAGCAPPGSQESRSIPSASTRSAGGTAEATPSASAPDALPPLPPCEPRPDDLTKTQQGVLRAMESSGDPKLIQQAAEIRANECLCARAHSGTSKPADAAP